MTSLRWYLKGTLPRLSLPRDSATMGGLFSCNHRILADPIYISITLDMLVNIVTYSLSKVCEWVSVIKTYSQLRKSEEDRKLMKEMLWKGDLMIYLEGLPGAVPIAVQLVVHRAM
ncbi:hypothetical protein Taro_044408 [Colocasia esculenta]|uniref:Uncharacterized protein n=1 Tax=Colocasia esculenta TaxID=4460 RepID=A0A843X0R7_COLES|nr:hypothetical protein [Colocasia esculenta]